MARRQQEGLHEVHENGAHMYDAAAEENERLGLSHVESGGNGGTVFEGDDTGFNTGGDLLAKKPKKNLDQRRADFVRLANRRVSAAIDAIDSLIHLCAPQSYAWTQEDRMEIFETLRDRIDIAQEAFLSFERSGGKKTTKPLSFRLPV
jgi:hypothetical protein